MEFSNTWQHGFSNLKNIDLFEEYRAKAAKGKLSPKGRYESFYTERLFPVHSMRVLPFGGPDFKEVVFDPTSHSS